MVENEKISDKSTPAKTVIFILIAPMSASVPNIKWYKESSTSVLPLADEQNSKVFKVPEQIANPVKALEESQNPSSDNKLIEAVD